MEPKSVEIEYLEGFIRECATPQRGAHVIEILHMAVEQARCEGGLAALDKFEEHKAKILSAVQDLKAVLPIPDQPA